jgi:cell division transport system permease protein
MLNQGAWFAYHLQAANHSLNRLSQKPLETMMTVIVIAIALTLPALFWVFTDNLSELTNSWQRQGHISLYLKSPLSAAEEASALTQVKATEGVGEVHLKTAVEGLVELQRQEGMQDIMRYLPENPLPAMLEVLPSPSINNPSQIEALYARLKAFPQVDQAKLDLEWINRLHAGLGFVTQTTRALMVLLAFAMILIIANSLRLAVRNQQEEIQVLKLIGATDAYIARPFLYSGIWYGLAGAILAVLFVNLFMLNLSSAGQHLALVYQMHYPMSSLSVKQAYLIVFAATFLGWLGAKLSVNRQIAFIEPYN